MFKRKPRSYGQMAGDMIYPRGGWGRAALYVLHRLRRLPDQPHRIGRGIAAGVIISFTPLFGFHFLGAAAIAWVIGGNILASLLATFVGNPLTIPFIATLSLGTGRFLLGIHERIGPQRLFAEFSRATGELWHNITAFFGPGTAHWENLGHFFDTVFLPYLLGGMIVGTAFGVLAHYLTVPVVRAYHARRRKKLAKKMARQARAAAGEPSKAPARRSGDAS